MTSPGRRPARPITFEIGQLASAAPRAPMPTGRPTHALVPVISAAEIPPTAIPIECPVLPSTCAASSAPMRRAGDHAGGIAAVPAVWSDWDIQTAAGHTVPPRPPGRYAEMLAPGGAGTPRAVARCGGIGWYPRGARGRPAGAQSSRGAEPPSDSPGARNH